MKSYIYLYIMLHAVSTTIHPINFDYSMASSVDTIFKREDRILNSQEAFNKLMQVALSFWNSNTKAVLNFIKDEKSSIQSTIHALSFIDEAIHLGQALQQSKILADFESQYLLAAIVLDKIALITNQLHNATDVIQFNPENILILKAQLTDLLDSLQLVKPTLQYSHLEVATNIALQISQPQLAQTKKLYVALGSIQTIDMYRLKPENKTAHNYVTHYKFIIDSRDDGNSGYRTFLASTFMHAVDTHQTNTFEHIKNLIADKFLDLFMQYDQLFPQNIRSAVGHAIKKYLVEQLKIIETCKNIEQVRQLWNDQPVFDFYMIKFLKYLIIDYVDKNTDIQTSMRCMHKKVDEYQKNIAPWGQEIEDLEYTILALATNISISVQDQTHAHQTVCVHQATPEFGSSSVVYTQNARHYQIAIIKKSARKKN